MVAAAVMDDVAVIYVVACAGVEVTVMPGGVSLTPGATAALAPHNVWMWRRRHCKHVWVLSAKLLS